MTIRSIEEYLDAIPSGSPYFLMPNASGKHDIMQIFNQIKRIAPSSSSNA